MSQLYRRLRFESVGCCGYIHGDHTDGTNVSGCCSGCDLRFGTIIAIYGDHRRRLHRADADADGHGIADEYANSDTDRIGDANTVTDRDAGV